MTTALDAIRVELAISREALLQEAALIPDPLLDTAPSDDAWSAAEVLDHLGVVEARICGGFEKTLDGAPPAGPGYAEPDLHAIGAALMSRLGTQATNPLKSTMVPERGRTRTQLLAALEVSRTKLLGLIDRAYGRDLSGRTFPHPIFGDLDLYAWLLFVARHEDRHCSQIARIRQALESTSHTRSVEVQANVTSH